MKVFSEYFCLCHCLCLCLCLLLVKSCVISTLIKSFKGHKSLGSLCSVNAVLRGAPLKKNFCSNRHSSFSNNSQMSNVKWQRSKIKWQMSNVNEVKPLSERTSRIFLVTFLYFLYSLICFLKVGHIHFYQCCFCDGGLYDAFMVHIWN